MEEDSSRSSEALLILERCLIRARTRLEVQAQRMQSNRGNDPPPALQKDFEIYRPIARTSVLVSLVAGGLTWVGLKQGLRSRLIFTIPAAVFVTSVTFPYVYSRSMKQPTIDLINQPQRESFVADSLCSAMVEMQPCLDNHACSEMLDKTYRKSLGVDAHTIARLVSSCRQRQSLQRSNNPSDPSEQAEGFGWGAGSFSGQNPTSEFEQSRRQDQQGPPTPDQESTQQPQQEEEWAWGGAGNDINSATNTDNESGGNDQFGATPSEGINYDPYDNNNNNNNNNKNAQSAASNYNQQRKGGRWW